RPQPSGRDALMTRLAFGLASLAVCSAAARGSPAALFVSYTVGGSPGGYDLVFQAGPTQTDSLPGDPVSGFIAHDTDPIAPTAVSWVARSRDAVGSDREPCAGGEDFNRALSLSNPAFEGVANPAVSAVPGP